MTSMKYSNARSFLLALVLVLIIVEIALVTYGSFDLVDLVVRAVQYDHTADMLFRSAMIGQ